MSNAKFALSIGGSVFQVSAADGGRIMDVLSDAPQIDHAWTSGTELEGRSHRVASYPADIRLEAIRGAVVSRDEWRHVEAKREAEREARKAAEAAAAEGGEG